ncbi:MAG: thioredoxin 1 [Clostridia bacterium]|nr:thioredoxin 1 [Clostridia bacterium]
MGAVINVDSSSFEAEILTAPIPAVVDFWAAWCGPCRMMAPVFEELAEEYAGRVKFAKLNVDENQGIAAGFGVMSIPTLIIFKEGREINRIVGYMPKEALKANLEAALK